MKFQHVYSNIIGTQPQTSAARKNGHDTHPEPHTHPVLVDEDGFSAHLHGRFFGRAQAELPELPDARAAPSLWPAQLLGRDGRWFVIVGQEHLARAVKASEVVSCRPYLALHVQ